MFSLVVAVVATFIVVIVANFRGPEGIVEDYLTAVADEDVAGALELVADVEFGDAVTFLTPEAISDDWRVESVTETRRVGRTAEVKAVLAGRDGSAEGVFTVREFDDGWELRNPFVTVEFPPSPVSYLQVNDQRVRGSTAALGHYQLFPGFYRFYQTVPDVVTVPTVEAMAAFPQSSSDARVVEPLGSTPGKKAAATAQRQLRAIIDDCAGFTTQTPHGCPFATDSEINTPDGKRVYDLHSLTWTVEKHPVAELANDRPTKETTGFTFRVTEPGTVRLTGGGEDSDDNPVTFSVVCAIDLTGVEATVAANGVVRIAMPSRFRYHDTCGEST